MLSTNASVAVLLTCFNRREQTLACLRRLSSQEIECDIYLVDDGSSDGTAEAVKAEFSNVKLLTGNGSLFWGGGMHLAFSEALRIGYEFYLWLNDDTMLYEQAIENLLATYLKLVDQGAPDPIVVGSVCDPLTKKLTYGGRVRSTKLLSFKFEPVNPGHRPNKCDTMQGNIVLIPKGVTDKIGNLDPKFIHTFGDLDYGLRATQAGCSVWTAPGFIGECGQNSVVGSWVDKRLSLLQRMQKVGQVKNFPIKPWTAYLKRHAGPLWFLRWPLPYIRAAIGYRDLKNSPTFCEKNN